MSLKIKFKVLHLATHLAALFGLGWAVATKNYGWLVVAFIGYLYTGIFGVNIALHRYFSHRSFVTSRFGYWFLLVSSFFPMLGSPAAWGGIHRFHHTHSDTELDPHNPATTGKLKSWFTVWPETELPLSLFRSFAKDRNILFVHNNYFRLIILYVVILAAIDWRLVCFLWALPAVGCFHGAAAIAVIPHLDGFGNYRSHETSDLSHNSFLAWSLSLGEGWHNNHHHDPTKFRHGENWWEIDHSAFIIQHFLKVKS